MLIVTLLLSDHARRAVVRALLERPKTLFPHTHGDKGGRTIYEHSTRVMRERIMCADVVGWP